MCVRSATYSIRAEVYAPVLSTTMRPEQAAAHDLPGKGGWIGRRHYPQFSFWKIDSYFERNTIMSRYRKLSEIASSHTSHYWCLDLCNRLVSTLDSS